MKTFKKILIVFSSYCLIVIILGIGCAKNDNYWYNEINKIVSTIDENNELLYYNGLQFYYKGKDYYFYRFVEDSKTDIAFINKEYLIGVDYSNGKHNYYLYDAFGNNRLIYTNTDYFAIDSFKNDELYFSKNEKCFVFNIKNYTIKEIPLEEYYFAAYETKYTLIRRENAYYITDTSTNIKRVLTIKNLLSNPLIDNIYIKAQKLVFGYLKIKSIEFSKNDIYINISADNQNCITLKYDFELEVCEIINKACWKYIENVRSYYLGDDDCKLIEYFLDIKGEKDVEKDINDSSFPKELIHPEYKFYNMYAWYGM